MILEKGLIMADKTLCDECKQEKPDAVLRLDPYDLEHHDEKNLRNLCNYCYHEISEQI